MKKVLTVSILLSLTLVGSAFARVQYDKSGHIIYDNTIRGSQRAKTTQEMHQRQIQAAAAAKIDYEAAYSKINEKRKSNLKNNYIQSRNKENN